MASVTKKKKEYGWVWYVVLIIMLVLGKKVEPLKTGSIAWFIFIFTFFFSVGIGVWAGVSKGKTIRRSIRGDAPAPSKINAKRTAKP